MTPSRTGLRTGYYAAVKKRPKRTRFPSSDLRQATRLRLLRKCLAELKRLFSEANRILVELLISPSANIIRGLCERFRILQEYFAMRYHEARALAFTALGRIETDLSPT